MKDQYALLLVTISVLVLATVMAGCSSSARIEPHDPNAEPVVSIALLVESVPIATDEPEATEPNDSIDHRGWPETIVSYQPAEVNHLALYMHEPDEKWAVDDGRFRSGRLEDVLAAVVDPAVFIARIAIMPVEAYLAPPWQEASSRGCFARREPAYTLPGCPSGMTRNEQYERDY